METQAQGFSLGPVHFALNIVRPREGEKQRTMGFLLDTNVVAVHKLHVTQTDALFIVVNLVTAESAEIYELEHFNSRNNSVVTYVYVVVCMGSMCLVLLPDIY